MGSKPKAPAAPDYTPVAEANKEVAEISAQVAREQLAEARRQYDLDASMAQRVTDTLLPAYERELREGVDMRRQITETILPAMRAEAAEAERLRARSRAVYEPLEDSLVADAYSYNSKARQDYEAGKAVADVSAAFEAERQNAQAALEGYGVDPSQTRAGALDRELRVQRAASAAGAANMARDRTEATGRALRGEALNIGKGYAGNVAGAYATTLGASGQGLGASGNAVNAGFAGAGQAIATQMAPGGAYFQRTGTAGSWMGQANQANANWGSLLTNMYGAQVDAFKAQAARPSGFSSALNAVGTVGGLAIGAFSSKDLKTDKAPATGALDIVKELPVDTWRYKPGVEDGGANRHVGTYAEDFTAATGSGDGKRLNLMDAVGLTMGAVKELAAKVDRMQAIPTR